MEKGPNYLLYLILRDGAENVNSIPVEVGDISKTNSTAGGLTAGGLDFCYQLAFNAEWINSRGSAGLENNEAQCADNQ